MPKTRERCETVFASRSSRTARAVRRAARASVTLAAFVAIASTTARARAATRRIALVRAEPELQRSVDLALYPWDIKVVAIEETPPDGAAPNAAADAQAIAERNDADAIAWLVPASPGTPNGVPTLWFFDTASHTVQSHPLPALPSDDPAELAAVALTLKTLVRSAAWEQREDHPTPDAATPPAKAAWETRAELEAMGRVPTSGADAEPRLGLWASEWRGTPRLKWGAALGASAGLGMTFDGAGSHGTLHDVDVRAAIGARIGLGRHFDLEPRVGASAHFEHAQVTLAGAPSADTLSRVNPSADLGLFLDWRVTQGLAWSVGVEALDSLRYQRWLVGSNVVFAPSPLWIQAGSSLAWSFR
jgi:hypothetical protein